MHSSECCHYVITGLVSSFFQVIVTTIPQHSFGLAVYGEYLFWTDWMRRAVVRANKHDGNIHTFLRRNLQRQPMGIAVVASDANDCE